MSLVVPYFAIMLLPLLIAVTASTFHKLADLYRIRTAVEPIPASA